MADSLLIERLKQIMREAEQRGRVSVPRRERAADTPDNWLEPLIEVLGLEHLETDTGAVFIRRKALPASAVIGNVRLDQCLEAPEAYSLLNQQEHSHFEPRDALFLDTETTGLAGGTGTHVFLVGIGVFQHDEFVVSQFLMPDHCYERPMLEAVACLVPNHRWIVSYNGKSFDVPLLETRYALCRLASPFDQSTHFDLLHAARRLWRNCCNLSLCSVERTLLGYERDADVPGYLIPSLFFDYLRTRNPCILRPVLDHNTDDICSMVALLGRMCAQIRHPLESSRGATELLNLGRVFERAGEYSRSVECYSTAPSAVGDESSRMSALLRLASLEKRRGRYKEALELWNRLTAASEHAAHAWTEIAKHLEHRERDYHTAIKACDSAISALTAQPALSRNLLDELLHRRRRLLDKLARQLKPCSAPEAPAR